MAEYQFLVGILENTTKLGVYNCESKHRTRCHGFFVSPCHTSKAQHIGIQTLFLCLSVSASLSLSLSLYLSLSLSLLSLSLSVSLLHMFVCLAWIFRTGNPPGPYIYLSVCGFGHRGGYN